MKCQHCKREFIEKDIYEHHIHPRFMDNKKGNGMKINLCKKCHDILHFMIPSFYWNLLNEQQKEASIKKVITLSKHWSNLEINNNIQKKEVKY